MNSKINKKEKFIKIILNFIIMFSLLLTAVACGSGGGTTTEQTTTQAAAETTAATAAAADETTAAAAGDVAAEAETAEVATTADATTTAAAAETTTAAAAAAQPADQPAAYPNAPVYLSDTSPITLDWYVDEEWYTRAKWGQDLTSQYITAKTGVTINIIIPKGDSSAYKTTMIASGDLPDIIGMGQWLPEWRIMRDNDMLYSFQELAEKYDPTLFDVMKPSILTFWREESGLNYVYPNSAWGNEDLPNAQNLLPSGAFSVRKDIYEALGSPPMRTPDEFLSALRLAKEQFAEINGQPIIPFLIGREFTSIGNSSLDQGGMKWLLNLPANERDFYTYDLNTDPEIIRWLRAINQAFIEGLISNDQFTDKETQIYEKLHSGRVFSTIAAANVIAESSNAQFYQNDPNTIFVPIEAMLNSKNEMAFYAAGGLAGWHVNMITKNCKDPERAIKFFHYWLSDEGQEDFYYGDPSMWDMKDGKKWMKDDLYELRNTDEEQFCSIYGGRDNYFMLIQPAAADKFVQIVNPWESVYMDFFVGKLKSSLIRTSAEGCDPDADTQESVEYGNLQAKWGELLPMMIIAGSEDEFNNVVQQYKEASDAAWPKFGPVMRNKFETNLKKFDLY